MRVLFAGPSLAGEFDRVKAEYPDVEIRPPALRGDLARAVLDGATAIGLVDGFFGDSASVWHKEILFALDRGLAVGGGSSMGALRAAECHSFGMVGLGRIFADYAEGRLLDDEAVALTHAPEELGWMPITVPWVNYMATLSALDRNGVLAAGEYDQLWAAGRQTHFSERDFARLVERIEPVDPPRCKELVRAFRQSYVDQKRMDAWMTVRWLSEVSGSTRTEGWQFAHTSQWDALLREISAASKMQ